MTRTPLALVAVAAACAAAGCTRECKSGTLLVALELTGAAASADTLAVDVSVEGRAGVHSERPLAAGATHGTIEIDYGAPYPAGATTTVTITALAAGVPVGAETAATTLGPRCGRLDLTVAGGVFGGGDAGIGDGGAGDGGGGAGGCAGCDMTSSLHDFAMPPPVVVTVAGGAPPQTNPSVASDGTDFFVVWEESGSIQGRLVGPDGTFLSNPITVAAESTGMPLSQPQVAFAQSSTLSTYYVVWVNNGATIHGRAVSRTGTVANESTLSPGTLTTGQAAPRITSSGGKDPFFVVWEDHATDSSGDLRGTQVDITGIPGGAMALLDSTNADVAPSVAGADAQGFVIAWVRNGNTIYTGQPSGSSITAVTEVGSTAGTATTTAAADLPALVLWDDGDGTGYADIVGVVAASSLASVTVASGGAVMRQTPVLAPFLGGSSRAFVAAWTGQPPVRSTSVIQSVIIDGTNVGTLSLPSDVAVDQSAPAVAVSNGHVCYVWQQASGAEFDVIAAIQ